MLYNSLLKEIKPKGMLWSGQSLSLKWFDYRQS